MRWVGGLRVGLVVEALCCGGVGVLRISGAVFIGRCAEGRDYIVPECVCVGDTVLDLCAAIEVLGWAGRGAAVNSGLS